MKFVSKFNFFNNISKEVENSPALMMAIWVFIILTNPFNSFINIIMTIICTVLFFIDFKKYKNKY